MGGGGLRILPHKKWHVWRRDNIERVLRDERKQEEQQQAQDAKERRLAQERRAQQLQSVEDRGSEQLEHVNLFLAEEAVESSKDDARHSNRGQKAADDTLRRYGKLPWYATTGDAAKKELTARQERRRKRELEESDPLQHMRPKEQRPLFGAEEEKEGKRRRRYIDAKEGPAGSDSRMYSGRYDRSSASPERRNRRRRREEDDKRSRKSNKEKSKGKEKLNKKEAMLWKLRREREERETSERRRAKRLTQG